MNDEQIIQSLDEMKLYKINNFDYLLNLTIRGITKNKINELDNKINQFKNALNKLSKLTNKDLWIQDLLLLKI